MTELTQAAYDKARRLYIDHCCERGIRCQEPSRDTSWAYEFTPRGEPEDMTVVVLRDAHSAELCRVNIDDAVS